MSAIKVIDQKPCPASISHARSGMFGFLAALFRAEPTIELIHQLRDPEFLAALQTSDVDILREFSDQSEQQIICALATEYARLFIGPGKHVSPHESVHRQDEESRLYGRSTVKVREFLETAGFRLQSDYKGLPDHIAVELEFMQTLTAWEAEAWETGNTALAMKCLELETRFLHEHLFNWVPRFCFEVIAEADLAFYREIARLMGDFLEMEKEHCLIEKHRVPIEKIRQQSSLGGIQ